MPRNTSKRVMSNIDDLTSHPPPSPLPPSQVIARISHAQGKNLFICTLPGSTDTLLAELAPIFRGKAWLRRGGYVLVDTTTFEGRDNKIGGQIVNVVRNERNWKKMDYWPAVWVASMFPGESSDEEESLMGKMPPNSDDEEEEGRM